MNSYYYTRNLLNTRHTHGCCLRLSCRTPGIRIYVDIQETSRTSDMWIYIAVRAVYPTHTLYECYKRNLPNTRYISAMWRPCKTLNIWIHVALWGTNQIDSIWIYIVIWGIYWTSCIWICICYVLLASKGMPNRAYVTLCVSNEGPWVGGLNTFALPPFPSTRKTWHLIQLPWFLEHTLVCGVLFLLKHSKGSVGLLCWQVYNIAQIRSSSCL